ncbi:uncharacterized protein CEXT_8762 [Caerostris extrusa]|uniref:Uncharacterized protein n=1 Tax=Caerostris extrusa TaxID=172846 RepID=A0AAV4QUC1_CAEEX|nr:uncharacterized protein CEXT_8762 [Caerostris extrusa]
MERNAPKINKCAVKLLGIDCSDLADEEILECVSNHIEPSSIEALVYDFFNSFYVLFLKDIESSCLLVGKKINFQTFQINVLPLMDCFIVDNVYPYVQHDELRDIFKIFGNVLSVSNHHAVPNSSKFSHVLSGKREIVFLLPAEASEINIPINVIHAPYSFRITKFCYACLTEGHSILHCPDIEDEKICKDEIKDVENGSDSELDSIIKSEDIYTSDKEDTCSDIQSVTENTEKMEKSFLPEKSVDYGNLTEEVNDVQDEGVSSSSGKDALLLQKPTKIRKIIPEGEKLIHKYLNNVHANVVKHILCGNLEAGEIIQYAFNCLEDVKKKRFHLKSDFLK